MQREIDTANAQQRLLATRLRQFAAAYRTVTPEAAIFGIDPFRSALTGEDFFSR
ncbi:MAG TPA: hypothetical protein VFC01_16795 [Mycobacterium sp.]|nr:hypothetical protein [Mycobacterium sp.]